MKAEVRHSTRIRARQRKRGRKLMIAYVLQSIIFFLAAMMLVLMVCGVLYIKEHLSHTPDSALPEGNVETDDTALSGTPVIPATPPTYEGVIIILDAGHGGIQSGCEFDGVLEKDITLSIVLLLQEKLESKGVTVILTRDADEDVSLSRRSEIANSAGANCFVSIHCNSYEDDLSIKGFECYHYQSAESKDLAEAITLSADNYMIPTRKTKEENYAILRDTSIPAVLIEAGFMSNAQERKQLLSLEHQELLAEAIASGILNYNNTH